MIGGVIAILILLFLWRLAECAGRLGELAAGGWHDRLLRLQRSPSGQNRQDWSDALVSLFVRMAKQSSIRSCASA